MTDSGFHDPSRGWKALLESVPYAWDAIHNTVVDHSHITGIRMQKSMSRACHHCVGWESKEDLATKTQRHLLLFSIVIEKLKITHVLVTFPARNLHFCRGVSYLFPHVPMIFPDFMSEFNPRCVTTSHVFQWISRMFAIFGSTGVLRLTPPRPKTEEEANGANVSYWSKMARLCCSMIYKDIVILSGNQTWQWKTYHP